MACGGRVGKARGDTAVEAVVCGRGWSAGLVEGAGGKCDVDYQPMSDMRASAAYRLTAAKNMLRRYFAETTGVVINVLEVQP